MTTTTDPPVSRRAVLRGLAGAAAVSVCPFGHAAAAQSVRPAGLAGTQALATSHAAAQRGLEIAVRVGRGAEGRYGLMFKRLGPHAVPEDLLNALATSMLDPRPPQADPSLHDRWDNPDITGGYTFLGQFLDHDMTRDVTPLAQARADPHGTRNFDTPFLDLGSVYGRGPALDPQLYEEDGARLRVGGADGVPDLPRDAGGVAVIGDPRNDENLIVAQLHVAFLGFHNHLIDAGTPFVEAQRVTRWEYQRLIVDEFLGRVVGRELVDSLLESRGNRHLRVVNRLYKPTNRTRPMMPIEYAAGAFRFGHSMIRPEYEMNDSHTRPIFAPDGDDLRGFRPLPKELHADWSYFFDLPGWPRPDGLNFSRKMDPLLAAGLHTLPSTVQQDGVANLAARNLLRGARVGLPAGQDVARAMGVAPLTNQELGLTDARWNGKAPFWFYVLREAELVNGGRRLGPVGGRVVAETILGLLAIDPDSYLSERGGYEPQFPTVGHFVLAAGTGRHMREENEDENDGEGEIEDSVELEDEAEHP